MGMGGNSTSLPPGKKREEPKVLEI